MRGESTGTVRESFMDEVGTKTAISQTQNSPLKKLLGAQYQVTKRLWSPPLSESKFVQYEKRLIQFNKYLLSTCYVPTTVSDEVEDE